MKAGNIGTAVLTSFFLFLPALGLAQSESNQTPTTDLYGDPLPPGAIARLGTVAFNHHQEAIGGCILPDNKTIFVCTKDGFLYVEASTGKLLRTKEFEPPFKVPRIAISGDRKKLCMQGTVMGPWGSVGFVFFDIETGEETARWDVKIRDQVDLMTLNHDGSHVALKDGHFELVVFDTSNGQELVRKEHSAHTITFSPDGEKIVIGQGPNKLNVWDWNSDDEPVIYRVPKDGTPRCLAFSPDGSKLAIGISGRDCGSLAYMDWESREIQLFEIVEEKEHYWTNSVVFLHDNQQIVTGDRRVWDTETLRMVKRVPRSFQGGRDLSTAMNGSFLVSCGGGLSVVDLRTDELISHKRPRAVGEWNRVTYLGDTEQIATAGDDGIVRIWSARTGEHIRSLADPAEPSGQDKRLLAIADSENGRTLVTSSLGGAINVWDVTTGELRVRLDGHEWNGIHRALAFSEARDELVSWACDTSFKSWKLSTLESTSDRDLHPDLFPGDPIFRDESKRPLVRGCALSDDGSRLVVLSDRILVFDLDEAAVREYPKHANKMKRIAISPDSQFLLSSSTEIVEGLLPDGRGFMRAADEHPVTIQDLESGEIVRRLFVQGDGGGPVAYSRDGTKFAVATSWENPSIAVFSSETGEELKRFDVFQSFPVSLAFAPDGEHLASVMQDANVLIWDIRTESDE